VLPGVNFRVVTVGWRPSDNGCTTRVAGGIWPCKIESTDMKGRGIPRPWFTNGFENHRGGMLLPLEVPDGAVVRGPGLG